MGIINEISVEEILRISRACHVLLSPQQAELVLVRVEPGDTESDVIWTICNELGVEPT